MWQPTLSDIKLDQSNRNVDATITYVNSDTGETFVQPMNGNDLTPDEIAFQVGNFIQSLDVRDLAIQTLIPGPIPIPKKTPEQQAKLDALTAVISAQSIQVSPAQPEPLTP